MPTPRKPITLNDLSDQDRTRLLEEAREASRRNPTDVEGYDALSDREKGIRTLMDARDHLRDCPVQIGTMLGRVEGYDVEQPPNPAIGRPRRMIAVVRCMECGGTTAYKDPPLALEEALAGVLEVAPVGAPSSSSSSAGSDDETP